MSRRLTSRVDRAGPGKPGGIPDVRTYVDFKHAVNMASAELEKWLEIQHSKEVGQKGGR